MTDTRSRVGRPSDRWLAERARALGATQRGASGQPRSFVISADGRRCCYLRAKDTDDSRLALWLLDDAGDPRLLVDPGDLGDETRVADAERARRERTRERAAGITSFSATPGLELVVFAHDGRLHVVTTADGARRTLTTDGPAVDPRPSPTGTHIAWVTDGALLVADVDSGATRVIAADDNPDVTWGLPEFIAAEEMGRLRGWWWAPDGSAIAACRVDTSLVERWWLHEPVTPGAVPRSMAYPAAGHANATVGLSVVDLDGQHAPVAWDAGRWPYLAVVRWDDGAPLTLAVQSRDQRELQVLTAPEEGGAVQPVRLVSGDPWVELVPGVPRWTPDRRLVTVEDDPDTDTRRVAVDGVAWSPARLHVDTVLAVADDAVVVSGSRGDPTTTALWRVHRDGGPAEQLTPGDGVDSGVVSGATMVITAQRPDVAEVRTFLRRDGEPDVDVPHMPIDLPLSPRPQFAELGERKLRAVLLLPSWHTDGPLPVLLDPYGGPHARRVRRMHRAYLPSQWFAEAGFAVLVIDGRGAPGRGLAWEHAVHGDLATCALQDQHDGLLAAADRWQQLDLRRVAIRGWSFGGYLAALAVLRRPDAFHVAVAGAPVTEWRLYDTHYTERYLGDPAARPEAYDRSSLLADAARLRRPLLLLHGMADDNVVVAHTLRLSQALLAAGRPHTVLPLSTTTHVARDPGQEASLLEIQLSFIRDALSEPTELRPAQ
ncbi:MAG TPA: prolyl oligopeptidase family serine peptidase [Euzebyales bacterium]|nr:prolyl oligopeptidase family serine peptidase [Euzebyales bacterium]